MSTGNGSGALAGLSTEELRTAIRAVLRDVLPPELALDARQPAATDRAEPVTLRTDGDLDAFVRRLAALCDDPAQRAALRTGRRRFALATGKPAPVAPMPAGGSVVRVERGAVTERWVKQAADQGAQLVLGHKAVLTPLARDKARTLGVIVKKEH